MLKGQLGDQQEEDGRKSSRETNGRAGYSRDLDLMIRGERGEGGKGGLGARMRLCGGSVSYLLLVGTR